jgi:hypothetical protein
MSTASALLDACFCLEGFTLCLKDSLSNEPFLNYCDCLVNAKRQRTTILSLSSKPTPLRSMAGV